MFKKSTNESAVYWRIFWAAMSIVALTSIVTIIGTANGNLVPHAPEA